MFLLVTGIIIAKISGIVYRKGMSILSTTLNVVSFMIFMSFIYSMCNFIEILNT